MQTIVQRKPKRKLTTFFNSFTKSNIEAVRTEASISYQTVINYAQPKPSQAAPPLKDLAESVFDLESGSKVIHYFYECEEKRKRAGKGSISFIQPTIEAYESEIALIEAIKRREAGEINQAELKQAADRYIEAHLAPTIPTQWTGDEVPLFYLRLFSNGEESHAFTCNKIQAQIITAFWQMVQPETTAQIIRL